MIITQKKLGFSISYDFLSPTQTHELLQLMDNSTFTHIFVPEIWGYDTLIQCARMATYASNLVFATGIINMYSRSPATMAQAAASIAEQSNNRFILGLGLSGPIVIENWHGLNYHHGSPMQRTKEYIEIIRLILSGEQVNYQGKLFKLRGFKLRGFNAPVDVPIYLAAFGKRNVQIAGELADGWLPIWTSFPELANVRTNFETGLSQRSPELIPNPEIAPFIITCASEDEKAVYYAQKQLAFYIGNMGTYYARVAHEYGFNEEVRKIIQAWKAGEQEIAIKAVTDQMLEKLAAVGTPDYVRRKYEEFRRRGVTLPVVWLPASSPPEIAMETIHTFLDE
ncbi:MAG: LLM class flavin-dependent oxidoreductase [Candidatus Hodarchaeales archaeon]